ncbi:MAG: DUF11 domain-containing protein [Saprospiraceae bacterium]|nr:DUF11 domain-containing protein [Saprospiraceae bacterium]
MYLKSPFRFKILLALMCCYSALNSQISGTVYRDYNANSSRDSSLSYYEPGIEGVQVIITGLQGNTSISFTDEWGRFIANPIDQAPYRVEFRQTKAFDFSAPANALQNSSSTSVQFILTNPASLSYGINYPGDYCVDPQIVTPCYVMGDPLDPQSAFVNFDAFIKFDYQAGGKTNTEIIQAQHGGLASNAVSLGTGSQIGSCWGVAVQKSSGKIFTSAALKRHSGIGPLSYGGLYELNMQANSAMPLIDLNSIGVPSGNFPDNTQRNLPLQIPPVSTDSLSYSFVGKISYGGMEISEDEKTLYIVSLHTRKLYSVFINLPYETPNASDVDSFAIPDPGCANGTFRPWAVKMHRGILYVGVVCDASGAAGTAADLQAYVYAFDPSTEIFTEVLSFPLDYPAFTNKINFNPWLDTWNGDCPDGGDIFCQYPQPVLSDIEFESEDVMILGIMDRYSMQGGINQHDLNGNGIHTIISFGDILRARYDNNQQQFILENNANDGVIETAGRNTGFGPGSGEFYFGDHAISVAGVTVERESVNGALSLCPGFRNVVTSCVDPFGPFTSGVMHLNNTSGDWEKRYVIIPKDFGLLVGKSNALGDMKIFSKAAPLEIGNYIWSDRNNNGIQDPTEPPIPGVEIELYKNNLLIATATTNEFGHYIFSNQPAPPINPYPNAFVYGLTELTPQTAFQLKIPSPATQAALNGFVLSPPDDGVPNNDQTDSDGKTDLNGDVILDLQTGISGQNDHSFDFGFFQTRPGKVSLSGLVISACNPLTNGFDLQFQLDASNCPVGDIFIELSTGETKIVKGKPDGQIQVQFKNLASHGIQDVNIRAYYIFDQHCRVDSVAAYDQPANCCPPVQKLCSNRDALVQLLAIPGMVHYCWFDSTTQTIVGNTESLLFDKTFLGLDDNYEAYYYYAIDQYGDTIWQQCNYRVQIVECCGLQVNTFLQTECNNNGTVNDPADDWFAVLVSADNAQAGPTSRYEVLLNGNVLGSASYGSAILVGMAPNSEFHADGVTTYKVEIRDADNFDCLDSLFTTPSICPRPNISVQKNLVSNTIQSDASHNIVYRIEIENHGNETGTYTLQDIPGFDNDIKVLAAFYTTNIPGKGGGALFGTGPWTIISNQLIAPGVKHTVFLTVNVRIDLHPGSDGDNIYTSCGSAGNLLQSGQGLFNRALLDFDGDGQFDLADTICTDIPYLELNKTLTDVEQTSLEAYTLKYLVTIKNKGGAAGQYNLLDRPTFEDDIIIQNASFISNTGAGGLLPNIVPVDGWLLASNQEILVGETDSFEMDLKVLMDFDLNTLGNNIYRVCGFQNSLIPRIGEGLFNAVMLDLNNDFRPEKRDTSCGDLPQIKHEKVLLSKIKQADESIIANYLIVVQNKGGATGTYDLYDIPNFEDDLVIKHAGFQINQGAPNNLSTNPGITGWLLANGRNLNAFSTDSFYIEIHLDLDYSSGSSGDNYYQACKKNQQGEFLAGFGIFNESTLDINSDGIPDQKDTVCTDFDFFDLALRKYEITSTTAKNGDYVAFRIAVYNQGSITAHQIEVTDYMPLTYTFDPILNPEWNFINDSTLTHVIDSIKPGDSVITDLIIRIHAGFKNVNDVINAAEITQFESPNHIPPVDKDSNPDRDRRNDNQVKPFDPEDDFLKGHRRTNPNEDEDDHDVATTIIFDLALRKVKANALATGYHQKIDFNIWLYNQGNVPSQNITLVDYIPKGYVFHQADNPEWNPIGNNMVTTEIPIIINPGDSVVKTITLEVLPTTDPADWVNMAEVKNAFIVTLHHILNILQDDFDSEHDMDINNDAGGNISTPSDDHIDDDGMDSNKDGITDEDDKDPASTFVWDLALKKVLLNPQPHVIGQELEFEITVYNQGTDSAGRVGIRDHIPSGYEFVHAKNTHWKLDGDHAEHIMMDRINPGDSLKVSIYLKLKATHDFNNWINFAEIVGSQNLDSLDRTGQDFDSREGSDNVVERSVLPGSPEDNDINSQDLGGEEDDHDPAAPSIFDLALCKLYHGALPVKYGDTALFSINVYNQGNVPAIQFSVVDYLPNGLSWIDNPGWIYDAGTHTATYTKDTLLNPGDSVRLFINLKIHQYPGGVFNLVNLSEIVRAVDFENRIYLLDLDSKYDFNRNNDPGGIPNTVTDNFIDDDGQDSDGDGVMDEDDHDPAMILIHDLALRKESLEPNGDTAIFRIKVFNQGNLPATSILIGDYLNIGYQWLPTKNPGWTLNGSRAEYRFNRVFNQGDIDSVDIRLLSLPSNELSDFFNWAEILQAFDTTGMDISMLDADSKPGSDGPHERAIKPGDPDDNNIIGGGLSVNQDEDDHDVAGFGLRAKIGDCVWHDKNANGIQETGEEGIANVMVELYNANTKIFVKSTKTNSSGKYLFDNILPGNYFIKFIIPPGYTMTKRDVGTDDKDSDPGSDNGTNATPNTNLTAGEEDLSWDLGLYKCIPISGFVFYDGNKDGIQQNTENGINGLYVYLFKLPSNTLYARVKTYSNNSRFVHDGFYSFCAEPGEYYVKVARLNDFVLSPVLQGSDPSRDSDLTEDYGEWTSYKLTGSSCDTIKDIGAAMYNPAFGLKVNTKDLVLYQQDLEVSQSHTGFIHLETSISETGIDPNKHTLVWTMEDNLCASAFRIERKLPGSSQFEYLAVYRNEKSTENQNRCLFNFNAPGGTTKGKYIYRIIALRPDGGYTMSNESDISSQDRLPAAMAWIYPNPTKEYVTINFDEKIYGTVHMKLTDIYGREFMNREYSLDKNANAKKIFIDLNLIPGGLYSIDLKAGGINERLALTVLK